MAQDALQQIEHIVLLILENRSFDHMLGFLYADKGNQSPRGQAFDGLTGKEQNLDASGKAVKVFKIAPATPSAYFMPGADPGEGYQATNFQLFGNTAAPAAAPTHSNTGFVQDFGNTLGWEAKRGSWTIKPGTTAQDIMGCFTPEALPVLSGLAKGYAVCDQWFASAPTETLPNRAFALAATSQGHMDDKTKSFTCPSIFGALSKAQLDWKVFGYTQQALTRHNFPDIAESDDSHFGLFKDFQAAASAGKLPAFSFLEPSWGENGNSQHPVGNVALGEQFILDVYNALRQGPLWPKTLFILTYDEHGGCYDHVAPPWNATPPDSSAGEFGFDFKRFGLRVPTLLISPLIPAGTVFRVAAGQTPLDHTSILKTLERRWNLAPLTARDQAACDVGAVLTLQQARTDNPLAGVQAPAAQGHSPAAGHPSHLQLTHAEMVSALPVPTGEGGLRHIMPNLNSADDCDRYIHDRTQSWLRTRTPGTRSPD